MVDPRNYQYVVGSEYPRYMLIIICSVLFLIAGAIISWRMKGSQLSMVSAMSIGMVYISLEASLNYPWYIVSVSHANIHTVLLTFVGMLSAPISSLIGAFVYIKYANKPNNAHKTDAQ